MRWYVFQCGVRQSSVRCFSPRLPKTLTSASTSTFPCTGLTSAYPRRYAAYAYRPLLLELSSALVASDWLPAHLPQVRATRGFPVPCVHFSATLGRCYTPCPADRAETTYRIITWPNGDSSRLGLRLTAAFAGSNSRRFNHTFAYAVHSRLLGVSPPAVSSLSPFRPCTPPHVYQVCNVGRCGHSSAERSGVGVSPRT